MSTSHHHLVGILYTTIWKAEIQRNSWSPLQACLVLIPLGLYVVNMTELKKETNKRLKGTTAIRVNSIYFMTKKILKRTILVDYCQFYSWVIKYMWDQFQELPFLILKVKIWRLVQLGWIRGFTELCLLKWVLKNTLAHFGDCMILRIVGKRTSTCINKIKKHLCDFAIDHT